jgi:hypothetical protein
MEVNEVWIPVVMFIGLSVVLSLWVWFRFKGKREMQVTLRSAIEKGQDLSPELIENLFGVILGEEDAIRPLLGIAMFPFSIGVAFLLMHHFGRSFRS